MVIHMSIVIEKVHGREVFDSRGNPTVEAELKLSNGAIVRAMVPSGASTGKHEALELRDGESRLMGKGVTKAVRNIDEIIAPKIVGNSPLEQEKLDMLMIELDGTENKSKLGANAILAVSMAIAKAGALVKNIPLYQHLGELFSVPKVLLPVPSFNVINGGAHAGNNLDIQEFMVFPYKAKSFRRAMEIGVEVYHELKNLLKKKYGKNAINVGDEGGFAPPLSATHEPLDLLVTVVENLGYQDVLGFALDSAASEFYKEGVYHLEGRNMSGGELIDFYKQLVESYPIVSLEDPFDEEDFENFAQLTKEIGNKIQIVGDDLLVTNVKRIQKGIDLKAVNALLLKVNQIGTITESFEAAKLVRDAKWGIMVSHRSGETEDPFIAHLAVGIASGQIKTGAPCRSERLAKYNELLRIEEGMTSPIFANDSFRYPI